MNERQSAPPKDAIVIRGAREHNLKNITLEIPKGKLVVLTGVSGSGKSSLAFDTLYAEGQRRYVESLSSYARQFLGQMEKPKVDSIRGLSPTIAIEQKAASNNPRSTVGTVTEVYDYLRVLYARVGAQHCYHCGRKAAAQDKSQIVKQVLELRAGTRIMVMAPLVQARKGEHIDIFENAKKKGFARARIDGHVHGLDESIRLDKKSKHDIDLIVDRLTINTESRDRLTDSIELALKEADGRVIIHTGDEDLLFSEKNACAYCGISFPELSPQSFSFNSPLGFCAECNGLGTRPEMDPDLVVPEPNLSIRQGAIAPWAGPMAKGQGWTANEIEWVADTFNIDLDIPWAKLPEKKRALILDGGKKGSESWEGLVHQLMRRMKNTESEEMKRYYMQYFSQKKCPECHGERLRKESRAVRVSGAGITELCRRPIDEASAFVGTLALQGNDAEIAEELKIEIESRLGFLRNVGLGYLTLDRAAATLSGGESQRIRLASQIGSELTGVIYVLDEPSIGLHQRDNTKLIHTLESLRDLGNSVIVVEHDQETIEHADWVIDFGPGAGVEGGHVVAEGSPIAVSKNADSLTGAYLSGRERIEIPKARRKGNGEHLEIRGATEHNLKSVSVKFPLGTLTAVTGVSGAGKSTLINRILVPSLSHVLMDSKDTPGAHEKIVGIEHLDKIIAIDQKPIGRTPRSNPATYTKIWDGIRQLYASTPQARTMGYDAGRFSFNVKGGRCEACGGDGVRQVEMHFLADVFVTCDVCKGARFNEATLRVLYKGLNISETLNLSVRDALDHFSVHRDIARGLQTLADVGLGYVQIGQSSPTLSGGEAQRIKLARELSRPGTGKTLYVLDEPTTGLHFADIEKLLLVINRLVEKGNTVIVIEHNLDVIKSADWIIDLGPEGGDQGGYLIAEGAPEVVVKNKQSFTGQYLKPLLLS